MDEAAIVALLAMGVALYRSETQRQRAERERDEARAEVARLRRDEP